MRVEFGVLGPVEVACDGVALRVSSGRQRAVLALLLLRANHVVAVDDLAEALWGSAPPPSARVTVQNYVNRLRGVLGAAGCRIVTRPPGYLIRVAAGELDVSLFEDLLDSARSAAIAGAWARAGAEARTALSLWRGDPLADVPSAYLVSREVPRLEELRLRTAETGIEADLRLGKPASVIGELRSLVGAEPLRERLYALLMTALYQDGRQAEALAVYQQAREMLVAELGVEPGQELRETHQRVLAGGQALPAAATPARQLPAAARYFTGRDGELSALTEWTREAGTPGGTVVISAIDGMGGVGKTALALHAAHRMAGEFPDGQLFIDLHGYTASSPPRAPGEALEWLLRALGVSAQQIPEETEARAALYRQRLAGTRFLIVLDNAIDEGQVRPLLPGDPRCLVLITSRRRLKGLDDARTLSLDPLPAADAVALLRAVAGPDRVQDGDPLAEEIGELCGRLPLALRIAGALLRHRAAWSLESLAALLRDRYGRVAALSDGERHLAEVFDLSYAGLGEPHQVCFRRLGLVPGPDADAYAAAALLECAPDAATALLEDLVDHNLLIEHAPGRYRPHDLIRAYARALAGQDSAEDRQAALDRLLSYYAHAAQNASILIARGPRPAAHGSAPPFAPALRCAGAARTWLRAERDNILAASAHARARGLGGHAVALAAGLAEILRADGPWIVALELHESAADTARLIGWPAARAAALNELGRVRHLAGDYTRAGDVLAQALKIYRENDDAIGEAAVLIDQGRARYIGADIAGAGDAIARALEIYRTVRDRHGQAAALNELGRLRHLTGDYAGAGDALSLALEIYREIDNRGGAAIALHDLGRMRQAAGDLSGASDALTQALAAFREIGGRQGEASALASLGIVLSGTGDHSAARDIIGQALDIFGEIGARGDQAWALNPYAAAFAAGGDLPRAVTLYRQALIMNRELRKPDDEAISLEGLSECHLSAGEIQAGLGHLRRALEIYQRLGMASDTKRVRIRLAEIAGR